MGFLSICNYLGSEEKLITHIGHICENSRRACQEIREELDSFKQESEQKLRVLNMNDKIHSKSFDNIHTEIVKSVKEEFKTIGNQMNKTDPKVS